MKLAAPDYYQDFHCVAEKCRHNCCIGWEIDIDESTWASYQKVQGSFGERLKNAVVQENGCAHFNLTEEERCPFLNSRNLCDIILHMGEEGLCQICTDHPRFRNEFSSHTEIGLGLCCEEAARLILSQKDPVKLIPIEEGEEGEPWQEEQEFLLFREQLFSVLQNRSVSVEERMKNFLSLCDVPDFQPDLSRWIPFFLSLERLDPNWTQWLEDLPENCSVKSVSSAQETQAEQLLVYFVYRHLADSLDDGRLSERAAFAVLSVRLIMALKEYREEDLSEIARMYSSEIEYSEENLEAILDKLEKEI